MTVPSVAELATRNRRLPLPGRLKAELCRRLVVAKLGGLEGGTLRLIEAGRELHFGGDGELQVTLRVHDPHFWVQVAIGGSIGAGESYMAGEWEADDLAALVRLLVRNRELLNRLDGGFGKLLAPLHRIRHALRDNTLRGSRSNIGAHYDLGEEFFRLFLDENLMYSSAIFSRPETSLEEASEAKLERLCRKLRLTPTDHVLEIGTGWGGFALHAATRYGCQVTTTTISPRQFKHARERIAAAGLNDRVTVLDRDYRELEGRFDKLVSIEMIEAVGLKHLDTFFAVCSSRLRPEGLMALQAITIDDRFFEQARRSVDFIQRYIFPGSALPSLAALTGSLARASDLTAVHLEDLGLHYAATLRCWRERLSARLDEVREQGFSERFIRMWEFYFSYCEGGFLERSISNVQLLLAKPRHRAPAPLGELA